MSSDSMEAPEETQLQVKLTLSLKKNKAHKINSVAQQPILWGI